MVPNTKAFSYKYYLLIHPYSQFKQESINGKILPWLHWCAVSVNLSIFHKKKKEQDTFYKNYSDYE